MATCNCICANIARITNGNDFDLLVALKETGRESSGNTQEVDISITSISSVKLYLNGEGEGITLTDNSSNDNYYSFSGGTVTLHMYGAISMGAYFVEIIGERANGGDFRFYKLCFVSVKTTDDGWIPADQVITYNVTGNVGVAGSSSGGSASVGTLNTTSETALSTSSSESFGGTINLHKVSKTGNYNDLLNKPTIPDAQVNADWNATEGKAVILNKPTIPTVNNSTITLQLNGTTVDSFTLNRASAKTINISGVEKVVTFDTLSGASVSPALGKYYVMSDVGTLTITLPSVTDMTYQQGFQIFMTTGASVAISFSENVYLPDGFSFEASSAYELNFIKNSVGWIVGVSKFVASNS